MKLDYKKTFLLGFGFFAISLVWALYNSFVPVFLRNFITSNTLIGFIMTLDNYAGIIIQPTFGALSDRTNTRFGRRMPYLLIGMPLAAVAVSLIPAHWNLISLIVIIVVMNIIMATFRSPTVALMPDITPEPLRSKANGIINFMGGLGALIAFFVGSILYKQNQGYPFYLASILIIISLVVLNLNIKEKRDSLSLRAAQEAEKAPEPQEEDGEQLLEERRFGLKSFHVGLKKDVLFLLIAIFLWFAAFNAVETFFTLYGKEFLHVPESTASFRLTFFSLAMMLAAVPAGMLATKIGRKKTILIGLVGMIILFAIAPIFRDINIVGGIMILGGICWALVTINSYPFVVGMTVGAKIGSYTGYYYLFSCLASIVSPPLCGALLDRFGYGILFTYSTVIFVLAVIALLFVKEPKRQELPEVELVKK